MENLKAESLQDWSIANWGLVPEADRKRCLDHLRTTLEGTQSGVGCLGRWRAQAGSTLNGKPVAIGSDDRWFHFGAGMAIRNILRQVMTDDMLPDTEQPFGDVGHNWDDFYIGAIHALATEPEKPDVIDRLRRWQALKIGDPFPPELEGANGWGETLHQDIADAIAEIKKTRFRVWKP